MESNAFTCSIPQLWGGLQSNGVDALTWNPFLLLQVLKVPTCSSTTCRRSSETRTFSRCSCLSETWFLPKSSSTNRQTLASASVRKDADAQPLTSLLNSDRTTRVTWLKWNRQLSFSDHGSRSQTICFPNVGFNFHNPWWKCRPGNAFAASLWPCLVPSRSH